MTHQVASSEPIHPRNEWTVKLGGASALITGVVLLLGMLSLILTVLQPRISNDWLSPFETNWLVKIFILHAEFSDMNAELQGLNLLDIFILLLVSITCFSISTLFKNARKVWSLIAFGLVLLGIVLFLGTQIAGRSSVMLAVLIISFVMLRDTSFRKATVYQGILASILLFVGDLTVGIHSYLIAILFGLGYMLLIAWDLLIAQNLFRLGRLS